MKQFKEFTGQLNEADDLVAMNWDKVSQNLGTTISQLIGIKVEFNTPALKSNLLLGLSRTSSGTSSAVSSSNLGPQIKPKIFSYLVVGFNHTYFDPVKGLIFITADYRYKIARSGEIVQKVDIADLQINKDGAVILINNLLR